MGSGVRRSIVVDERESITSDMSHINHSGSNRSLDFPVQGLSGEPIAASGLIGQGGANPRLHIAHVPGEILALGSAQFELLQRSTEPVDAIGDLLDAVLESGSFSGLEALELVEFGDEVTGREGPVEAEREGGLDELLRVLLDGGGVVGEGFEAEGGVLGGAAGGFDEVG